MRHHLRTALVVGVVLAVALAGTATAAKLITGKQIKDGSIGLADLSTSAKRSLAGRTGQQGPAGPPGATGSTGPAGAAGPQGPAGLPALTTEVRAVTALAPAGDVGVAEVRCPPGMTALSGSVNVWATYSGIDQPNRAGDGWIGGVYNAAATPEEFDVIVICAPGSARMPSASPSGFSGTAAAKAALRARFARP